MAKVTVSFEAYQEGRLPHVCLVSGESTDRVLIYVTPLGPARRPGLAGWFAEALERLAAVIDSRRPTDLLLGRVPVSPQVHASLLRSRRLWTAVAVAGVATLVLAALAGTWWAPGLAGLATVGTAVALYRRRKWRDDLPVPTLSADRTTVTLDGVHERFAQALGSSGL